MKTARFRLKLAKHATTSRFVLSDRVRPAYLGRFRTLDAACMAMDNAVRRELGMPERFDISIAEIRDAMKEAS